MRYSPHQQHQQMLGLDHFLDGESEVVQRGNDKRYDFRRDSVRCGRRVGLLPPPNGRIGHERRVVVFYASFRPSTKHDHREERAAGRSDW